MSQAVKQREARRSIQATVMRYGLKLRAAPPAGIIAALVAAACMPVVWPLLGGGTPESAKAAVALLGGTGGAYISDALKRVVERLRGDDGPATSRADAQEAIERELLVHLEAEGEHAAGLRADVAALLDQVGAIETAVEAAPLELQRFLTSAFTEIGNSFGEFRWMLDEVHDVLSVMGRDLSDVGKEQRRQGRQQRAQTVMTEEILDRLRYQQSRPASSSLEERENGAASTVLPVIVPTVGAATAPSPAGWQGGAEVAIGDRVYLLHDDLLEERFSHDHLLVRRRARGMRLLPAAQPGRAYVWLRQVEARHEDSPTARKALGAVSRERELLKTLKSVRGLPPIETFADEGHTATLAVGWPASRSSGTLCETLDMIRGRQGEPIIPSRLYRLCGGLAGLCNTLTRLHEHGCTHRSLTLTGIIVLDGGDLVLRDLGLAAWGVEPGEGPDDYQAPEQLGCGRGRPGPKTDVYQLAAVAYHLLTGHPPNAGTPLPVRGTARVVPERLSEVLDAALSRDPAQRPGLHQLEMTLRAARREIV